MNLIKNNCPQLRQLPYFKSLGTERPLNQQLDTESMKNGLLLLCVLVIAYLQPVHGQWEKANGFNNGRVEAFSNQGQYLVAATLGGIYRTTNPTNGWENVTTGDESQSFSHLFEFDGEVVVTNDNSAQAHRSTDGGASWSPLLLEGNFIEFIAKKNDTYVAKGTGYSDLHYGTDGSTWTALDNAAVDGYQLVYADGGYFYFHSQGWVLKRSSDLINFEEVGPASVYRYFVNDDVIVGNPNGSIIYSTNGGSTFTTLTGHPDFANASITIDAVRTAGDVWMLASRYPNSGLFLSEDAGTSWQFYQSEFINSMIDLVVFNGNIYGASEFTTVFKVDFNDEAIVATPVGNGITVPSAEAIVRGGNNFYYQRVVSGIFEADGSMSFSTPFNSFPETQAIENRPSLVHRCNDGAFVAFTTNNPALYYRANNAPSYIDITGNLFNDNLIQWYDDIRSAAVDGNNIAVLLTSDNLVVTSDGGSTWTMHENPGFNTTRAMIFYNGSLIASSYGGSQLLRSDDLGASVYEFGPSLLTGTPTIIETNGSKLFISNLTQRAITSDGGETWEIFDNPSWFRGAAYITNSDSTIIALTLGENRVLQSNDFGSTFDAVDVAGLPEHLPDMTRVLSNDMSVFIQVPEGNIYRIGRAELGISTEIERLANTVLGWMVYPNPARDRVLFDALTEASQIDLFDLNGRMVLTQVEQPGSISLGLNNLPLGMYIATRTGLQSGSRAQTRLLIQ